MKTIRWLLCVLAGLALAATLPAQVKPGTKGKSAPKAEEEEMGKIEGMEIVRPNGHFLGLTLVEGKWTLTFYDKKKKPEPVDVTRALARWSLPMKSDQERTVLNPGSDPTKLVGIRFVRGPYAFKLFLTLVRGEGENAEAVETYSLDYHG
jgi:hypothetical protein